MSLPASCFAFGFALAGAGVLCWGMAALWRAMFRR